MLEEKKGNFGGNGENYENSGRKHFAEAAKIAKLCQKGISVEGGSGKKEEEIWREMQKLRYFRKRENFVGAAKIGKFCKKGDFVEALKFENV
jgi:hypothetical protein